MPRSIRMVPDPLRTLAFGSVSDVYMGIGTVTENTARMVYISNLTDNILLFSFDGVNDVFPLPVYGFVMLDICFNKDFGNYFGLKVGQRIYVKARNAVEVPKTGTVNVTVFHGYED